MQTYTLTYTIRGSWQDATSILFDTLGEMRRDGVDIAQSGPSVTVDTDGPGTTVGATLSAPSRETVQQLAYRAGLSACDIVEGTRDGATTDPIR